MRNTLTRANQPVTAAEIAAEIERLSGLPLKDLRAAWAAEFQRDPPKNFWRDLLLRTLAWQLQEKAFGGYNKATLEALEACGPKRAGDERCRRLKTGTVLIRDIGGIRHTVTIVPEGFIWQEKTYPSLSHIARIITGTNWNGPRFFGLREGKRGKSRKPRKQAA